MFALNFIDLFLILLRRPKQLSLVEADPRGTHLRRLNSIVRCVQQQRQL
jgi:hypothetical protein